MQIYFKLKIHSDLKFHPFSTHHNVNGGSDDIFIFKKPFPHNANTMEAMEARGGHVFLWPTENTTDHY